MQETGKTQLRLLATSHAMNHVYQLLTPVVIPEITREYGLSDFTAGLLISCFRLLRSAASTLGLLVPSLR